jgi:hypothetical protein
MRHKIEKGEKEERYRLGSPSGNWWNSGYGSCLHRLMVACWRSGTDAGKIRIADGVRTTLATFLLNITRFVPFSGFVTASLGCR